ncbi:MAG TPA: hypothetical protein VLG38_04560 [Gammaproteobacteria bacterium]|nr:hypothetical protein [Gammaproteobacteria bacterium]
MKNDPLSRLKELHAVKLSLYAHTKAKIERNLEKYLGKLRLKSFVEVVFAPLIQPQVALSDAKHLEVNKLLTTLFVDDDASTPLTALMLLRAQSQSTNSTLTDKNSQPTLETLTTRQEKYFASREIKKRDLDLYALALEQQAVDIAKLRKDRPGQLDALLQASLASTYWLMRFYKRMAKYVLEDVDDITESSHVIMQWLDFLRQFIYEYAFDVSLSGSVVPVEEQYFAGTGANMVSRADRERHFIWMDRLLKVLGARYSQLTIFEKKILNSSYAPDAREHSILLLCMEDPNLIELPCNLWLEYLFLIAELEQITRYISGTFAQLPMQLSKENTAKLIKLRAAEIPVLSMPKKNNTKPAIESPQKQLSRTCFEVVDFLQRGDPGPIVDAAVLKNRNDSSGSENEEGNNTPLEGGVTERSLTIDELFSTPTSDPAGDMLYRPPLRLISAEMPGYKGPYEVESPSVNFPTLPPAPNAVVRVVSE